MTVYVPKKDRATTGLRHASRTAGIVVASSLLVGATQVHSQDVAEAARQARARKEDAQKKNKHVYTEQDLQRSEILTHEDRAEIAAKKHAQPVLPGVLPQESFDADLLLPQSPLVASPEEHSLAAQDAPAQNPAISAHDTDFSDVHVSLGEVARAYRKQKELAAQSKNFHLPFSEQPTLAAPKPLPLMVAPPRKPPAAPEQFQLRKPMSAPTEKARAFTPTLRSPFGRPGVQMPVNSGISASQATPATPLSAPIAKPKNFSNSRVAPNVPVHVTAAPTAPSLRAPKISIAPDTLAAPATVAKPRTSIRLTETPSPVVRAQTSAAPLAPNLQTAPVVQSAPFAAPKTVAKPAPVLLLDGTAGPLLPNHAVPAPTAPALRAPQNTVAPELAALAAPAVPATEFVAPSPAKRAVGNKKSVVVAPILNLVAPRTIPANPPAVLPPAVLSSVAKTASSAKPSVAHGLAFITVQVGDSLWTLAQKNLGDGSRWHELVAVNPAISNPNHILAGTTLALPASDLPALKSNATKHVVKKGDTLWSIAKSRLGKAFYWSCIAQANPTLRDPDRIYEQQEILIPASCKE